MVNHELLIRKGFKLNEYVDGKYYELTIEDHTTNSIGGLLNTLGYNNDFELMPEKNYNPDKRRLFEYSNGNSY